ncbi:hypothetical protein AA11825_1120 [Acetobacter pomorum DSM 11825]|nr:hypothetical protein AA11825_1120 [Acetobacter pomorum DSM 11825]
MNGMSDDQSICMVSIDGGWSVPQSSMPQLAKAMEMAFNNCVTRSQERANRALEAFSQTDFFKKNLSSSLQNFPTEIVCLAFMEFCLSDAGSRAIGIDNTPSHPLATPNQWSMSDHAYLASAVAREALKHGLCKGGETQLSLEQVAEILGSSTIMRNLEGGEIEISPLECTVRLHYDSETGKSSLNAWGPYKTLIFCMQSINWDAHPDHGGHLKEAVQKLSGNKQSLEHNVHSSFGNPVALENRDAAVESSNVYEETPPNP